MKLASEENILECIKDIDIDWAKSLFKPYEPHEVITVTFTIPPRYSILLSEDDVK
jgi:hypothetical protein